MAGILAPRPFCVQINSLKGTYTEHKWFWRTWLLTLTAVSLVHLSTIAVAPFLHKDEFLIVELGRIILNPKTDWSIAWMTQKEQPVFFLFYLGPILQEFTFQVAGEYGPRISAFTGALIAATMTVNWLLAKGTSKYVAFILGLAFLLDPVFVQAFGLGRVDGWMMAFCIGACWVIADNANRMLFVRPTLLRMILAGALYAMAFFIWPTAIYLFPLLFLELMVLSKKYRLFNKDRTATFVPFMTFVVGFIAMAIILLIPIFPLLYSHLYNTEGLRVNIGRGLTGQASGFHWLYYFDQVIELFRFLKFTPAFCLAALICAVWTRQTGLITATLVAVIFLLVTVVYIHRVQYLLPYFVACIAAACPSGRPLISGHGYLIPKFLKVLLFMLFLWPVSISVGARFILAVDHPEERNRELVYEAAQSKIGPGNKSVLSTFEFYYSGRELGWKMYIGYSDTLSTTSLKSILPHVDYAILHQYKVSSDMDQLLKQDGMRDLGSFYFYDAPREGFDGKTSNVERLRNLFSIFRKPYGPYQLYAR